MKKLWILLIMGMILVTMGCSDQKASGESASEAKESSNKLERILAEGKIVVGTSADYPPYEFHAMIDGKDEIVGFDIEIAKEIAKGLGVELEIQDMSFDAVLAGVGSGMIDIGVAGINPSPERDEQMDFSEIYYSATHTILVLADQKENYASVEDLKGKTIGVQIGTIQEELAKTQIEGANVKSLGKVTDLVLELKTGLIDVIILEGPVANSYAMQNKDLSVVESVKFEQVDAGSSVITANGEKELMAEINKILQELKASGKVDLYVSEATKLADEVQS